MISRLEIRLKSSLSDAEGEDLKKEFEKGYNAYNSVSALDNPGSFFKKEAKELIDRGLSDIHGCVTVLKETKDSQLPHLHCAVGIRKIPQSISDPIRQKKCQRSKSLFPPNSRCIPRMHQSGQ